MRPRQQLSKVDKEAGCFLHLLLDQLIQGMREDDSEITEIACHRFGLLGFKIETFVPSDEDAAVQMVHEVRAEQAKQKLLDA